MNTTMPYRPFHSQTRVEYIKKKFENSVAEENKTESFKYPNSTVPYKTKILQNVKDSKENNAKNLETDTFLDTVNKNDGKALVKRTPAFRRDKLGCAKSLTKIPYLKPDDAVVQKQEEKSENAENTNVEVKDIWKELQRSKTDTNLLKYCDSRNRSIKNSVKSALNISKCNLVDDKQDKTEDGNNKAVDQYSVVDKNKKKSSVKEKVDLKLSDSIRRALQSPLPKGPPPKKPPRTFCHIPQSSTKTSKTMTSKADIPKLKSKLEKLENVIKNHKISCQTLPNENFKADLQKKLSKIPGVMESSSSPSVLYKKNDNPSCLPLDCLNQDKNNDVYIKLTKKSEFYLDLPKSESLASDVSESGKECIDVKSDNVTVKRRSSEPIYDLPCVNKKNLFETFGKFSKGDVTSKSNKAAEGLHYMCTDVVKQVPVFPPYSAKFDRRIGSDSGRSGKVDSKPKFLVGVGKPTPSAMTEDDKNHVSDLVKILKIATDNEKKIKANESLVSSVADDNGDSDSNSSPGSKGSSACSKEKDPDTVEKCSREEEEAEDSSQMTARRKNYVSKVSSKLFDQSPYWKGLNTKTYTHLFECCLLVGLTLCESKKNVPYIKSVYPPKVNPPPMIEFLCFPDASHWPLSSENQEPEEQYYSLVVTNENGERKFGYCRRVLPEGGHFCLPLTYCIISPHRAGGFFYKVLEELESRHGSSGVENFIMQLYESQFPGPGERLKLKEILEEAARTTPPTTEKYISSTLLRRPCDVRLEEKDLCQLFKHLQLSVLLKVFSSLLHERKVLLISNSLRKLSSCIEALQSTLLPFLWQHTYIPVLPVHLIEMCEAPTPYVIGLLKSKNLEESLTSLNFEDGILVDLDDSKILKSCGDESTILPSTFIKDLKTSLSLAKTATELTDSVRNVLISDAFIRFFVQVCGNYSKFIINLPNRERIFEKEEFIKSVKATQPFLEWFTETAMFNSFIHERLHGEPEDVLVKLFRLRAMEYSEDAMKNSTVVLKNYKVLNRKVRTLGDKIKDFTSFNK